MQDRIVRLLAVKSIVTLVMTGALPGGAPWDAQPAWRVGLWEHLISEQQRAEMLANLMR